MMRQWIIRAYLRCLFAVEMAKINRRRPGYKSEEALIVKWFDFDRDGNAYLNKEAKKLLRDYC